MFNIKPKEDKFYKMFVESAKNVNEGAIILRKNLHSLEDKENDLKRTEALENKGDDLLRDIIKELSEAFITPIDREDIYSLVKEMDNVLDLINSTMHRFIMFNITKSTEESKVIGDMIVQATEEMLELMDEIKFIGNRSNHINEKLSNIIAIEEKADKFFRKTVAELFRNNTDPFTVMKWKEIYQILEDTIDKCEQIAVIVEGVVIKNA